MEIILAITLAALVIVIALSVSNHSPTPARHHRGRSVAEITARLAAEERPTYVIAGRRC
ncbi:hypothetical protein H0264_07785 [Nocardia huaxiensis]|uniref:Uncharacterized protein n=1 Tax=Nocardia huaxiensis TaxID=2755382 RepID=A0A7D6ZRN5_9NOCA|nr:hypothetical protein [Nocardia huaxiensis]QLY32165.1 hypothetical protein H0264_07785 [Nocardia huaxiensis]